MISFYTGLTWNSKVVSKSRWYKYIVLHHTATTKCMTAEEMKMSMFYTYVQNKWFTYIPTHYIIWCNWDFVKVNELDTIVWATLNEEANVNWIHIEIVGDFNKWEPNESQYVMVNQLINWILEKYPDMEIKWHGDFQAKNCPGINFDWSKIYGNINSKYYSWENKKEEITFSLSRYYSVQPNQKRYYNWRTYEEDFKMNCAGDCTVPSDWWKLTNEDAWKSVACPKEYPLGTKFYLEWIGEVKCRDRWWAITKQWEVVRLDMYCWLWDYALDNWSKCPTWIRKWYIIQ